MEFYFFYLLTRETDGCNIYMLSCGTYNKPYTYVTWFAKKTGKVLLRKWYF